MLLHLDDHTLRLPRALTRLLGQSVVLITYPDPAVVSVWREADFDRELQERTLIPPDFSVSPLILMSWMSSSAVSVEIGTDRCIELPPFLVHNGRLNEATEVMARVVRDRLELRAWPYADFLVPDAPPPVRLSLFKDYIEVFLTPDGPTDDRVIAMQRASVDACLVDRAVRALLSLPVDDRGAPTPDRAKTLRTLLEAGALPEALRPTVETITRVPDDQWRDIRPLIAAVEVDEDTVPAWTLGLFDAPPDLASCLDTSQHDPLAYQGDEPPMQLLVDAVQTCRDAGWEATAAFDEVEEYEEVVEGFPDGTVVRVDVTLDRRDDTCERMKAATTRIRGNRSAALEGVDALQLTVRHRRVPTYRLPDGSWTADANRALDAGRLECGYDPDALIPAAVRRSSAPRIEISLFDVGHRRHDLSPELLTGQTYLEPGGVDTSVTVLSVIHRILELGWILEEHWEHEPSGIGHQLYCCEHTEEADYYFVRRR